MQTPPNSTKDNTPMPAEFPDVGDQVLLICHGRRRIGKVKKMLDENNVVVWEVLVPKIGRVKRFANQIEFVLRPRMGKEF